MNPHRKFIETSIFGILEEAFLATKNIGVGIETYPLYDYIVQSIFIKMTGAQEQKLKCIVWELATNDFDFRRDFLTSFSKFGFSKYDEKNSLFRQMITQIKMTESDFVIANKLDKEKILKDAKINGILNECNFMMCSSRDYANYKNIFSKINYEMFAIEKENNGTQYFLFDERSILLSIYENNLYRNRNQIAHNTKSPQQNLPALERLKNNSYQYENYFLWFSVLILIDNIFMELYKIYLETLEQRNFI